MPKRKPPNREEKASDLTTNPGGRPADATAEVPVPKLLNELAQLLAHALAKRWLEEHKCSDSDRDANPTASS
ncbi:MAG: hypothetical protein ACYSUI_16605 [Planctomycetota bacterium]|jgi:hypothetical protein